ncbi:hypothetical protein LCGC14_1810600 [marine sediment metagenome]|uniref:Uncharacterized protein n=1 Tax=marine sediment metagenome TaxID=412755 RepID=A0A0F9JLM1_9ZZZZ
MIADKKIDRMVLIAEVEGKCYSIIITKETQDAILSLIELSEGGIKVLDEPIEGIQIQEPDEEN